MLQRVKHVAKRYTRIKQTSVSWNHWNLERLHHNVSLYSEIEERATANSAIRLRDGVAVSEVSLARFIVQFYLSLRRFLLW